MVIMNKRNIIIAAVSAIAVIIAVIAVITVSSKGEKEKSPNGSYDVNSKTSTSEIKEDEEKSTDKSSSGADVLDVGGKDDKDAPTYDFDTDTVIDSSKGSSSATTSGINSTPSESKPSSDTSKKDDSKSDGEKKDDSSSGKETGAGENTTMSGWPQWS